MPSTFHTASINYYSLYMLSRQTFIEDRELMEPAKICFHQIQIYPPDLDADLPCDHSLFR